ncbi:MAG: segregation/condensation protein A [Candidatus Pacebacteria bacterium]|nr:segregation/condensation protein A [Candidatus Paceibacterota bacterium]
MSEYLVKFKNFEGPLYKLLELIEEKHLEITEMSLGAVTSDFLDFLRKSETGMPSDIISDFLVIASRLILIKSKELIPGVELKKSEDFEIKDLENRLKIYREFLLRAKVGDSRRPGAAYILRGVLSSGLSFSSRGYLRGVWKSPIFIFPNKISLEVLKRTAEKVFILEDFKIKDPEGAVKKLVIRLEEKIIELLDRLNKNGKNSFNLLTKTRPKMEIIVLFLAVLHLARDRKLKFEQKEKFGDIILEKEEELISKEG